MPAKPKSNSVGRTNWPKVHLRLYLVGTTILSTSMIGCGYLVGVTVVPGAVWRLVRQLRGATSHVGVVM
jgi:hypothetical protein